MNKLENISKGYENISVEVIDYNMNIAKHAWDCYKMTWNDLQDIKYDPDNHHVKEAIRNITLLRALPMPREQAIITFRVNNISRVCLAQLTRQRKAAFNVESQMPRPIRHNVIMPLSVINMGFEERAKQLIELSQQLYDDMIDAGMPPQDARYLIMHGQTTSLVYVVNVNDFVAAFSFRVENNLSDEINLVYRLAKNAILERVRKDYEDGKIDSLTYDFYTNIIIPADAAGAAKQVGQNYDAVFGNSFKRFPDANEEVTNITKNCDYDYTKSAWYLELIKLYKERPHLLFPYEKEMIEKWLNENE
ncbi:MAG TPA: FAD-dependent thymidylate synthase [Fervidobacterium sp.]|nr:FAD-dependent thymidylate synthase [Fervidobacterium sp.]